MKKLPLGWSSEEWAAWLCDKSQNLDPYIQQKIMLALAEWLLHYEENDKE